MIWKAIGQSATGTSHTATVKPCEDSLHFRIYDSADGEQILIVCASDGAGSASHGGWAANYATTLCTKLLQSHAASSLPLEEGDVYAIVEQIYDGLKNEAENNEIELAEYSCTLLGCYLTTNRSVFFQIGDGAIIRDDGNGYYIPVWWPQNGEYLNSTAFIIDSPGLGNLNIMVIEEPINELAIFTDGLQMLALNMESVNVHQPFFTGLFKYLRIADEPGKINVLDRKLAEYLDGKAINDRTDDDKTLFLATRLSE